MKVLLHPEAETELYDTIVYYENCESGLGIDFHLEFLSTIEKIKAFPLAWPIASLPIRRCLFNRFPYGILYSVNSEEVFILAVMNLHKDPDYWKKRI